MAAIVPTARVPGIVPGADLLSKDYANTGALPMPAARLPKFVCAIYIPNPDGGISFRASGVLIASHLVLTWAHVFRYDCYHGCQHGCQQSCHHGLPSIHVLTRPRLAAPGACPHPPPPLSSSDGMATATAPTRVTPRRWTPTKGRPRTASRWQAVKQMCALSTSPPCSGRARMRLRQPNPYRSTRQKPQAQQSTYVRAALPVLPQCEALTRAPPCRQISNANEEVRQQDLVVNTVTIGKDTQALGVDKPAEALDPDAVAERAAAEWTSKHRRDSMDSVSTAAASVATGGTLRSLVEPEASGAPFCVGDRLCGLIVCLRSNAPARRLPPAAASGPSTAASLLSGKGTLDSAGAAATTASTTASTSAGGAGAGAGAGAAAAQVPVVAVPVAAADEEPARLSLKVQAFPSLTGELDAVRQLCDHGSAIHLWFKNNLWLPAYGRRYHVTCVLRGVRIPLRGSLTACMVLCRGAGMCWSRYGCQTQWRLTWTPSSLRGSWTASCHPSCPC